MHHLPMLVLHCVNYPVAAPVFKTRYPSQLLLVVTQKKWCDELRKDLEILRAPSTRGGKSRVLQ